MEKASNLLTAQDCSDLETFIAKAESKTSGEIVPVIATRSGNYDHASHIVGFFTSLLVLCGIWFFCHDVNFDGGNWQTQHTLSISLVTILLLMFAGFIVGSWLASFFPILKVLFITKREMQETVSHRAKEAFIHFRVGNTKEATGIVIYVSLYERMVHVQGDLIISEKLQPEDWQIICNMIVDGIYHNNFAEGMRNAIEKAGELLSQHFPIKPGDTNELPNKLHFID